MAARTRRPPEQDPCRAAVVHEVSRNHERQKPGCGRAQPSRNVEQPERCGEEHEEPEEERFLVAQDGLGAGVHIADGEEDDEPLGGLQAAGKHHPPQGGADRRPTRDEHRRQQIGRGEVDERSGLHQGDSK